MNTLIPTAPSISKTSLPNRDSQMANARSLVPTIKPNSENRARVTVTQAEHMFAEALAPSRFGFSMQSLRTRATRQQIETAVLSFLFVSIAITFGLLICT